MARSDERSYLNEITAAVGDVDPDTRLDEEPEEDENGDANEGWRMDDETEQEQEQQVSDEESPENREQAQPVAPAIAQTADKWGPLTSLLDNDPEAAAVVTQGLQSLQARRFGGTPAGTDSQQVVPGGNQPQADHFSAMEEAIRQVEEDEYATDGEKRMAQVNKAMIAQMRAMTQVFGNSVAITRQQQVQQVYENTLGQWKKEFGVDAPATLQSELYRFLTSSADPAGAAEAVYNKHAVEALRSGKTRAATTRPAKVSQQATQPSGARTRAPQSKPSASQRQQGAPERKGIDVIGGIARDIGERFIKSTRG